MRLFSLRWLHHSYQDSTSSSFSGETSASVVQRLSMLGPGLLNCISLESPTESQLSPVAHWGVGSNLLLFFLLERQAAYGVLPVGLEGQVLHSRAPPSLCFWPAGSSSATLSFLGRETLGTEENLAALIP